MDIYLIRHTTPNIAKGICYGQSNVGITNSFFDELKNIKTQLPQGTDFTIYSSPLFRCYTLAKHLGNLVYLDSSLKEINFGTWEQQAWNDIPKNELNPWMENFVYTAPPKGESYIELKTRVLNFFNQLIKNTSPENSIIIVTHAGPIRALLAHIQNINLVDSFDIKVAYSSITKLNYNNETVTLAEV